MLAERTIIFVGTLALIGFFLAAFSPLPSIVGNAVAVKPHIEPSGAIVVLASSVKRDGSLDYQSLTRTMYGIALYRRQLAPVLVLSGSPGTGELIKRVQWAADMGIRSDAILTQNTGRTTREESAAIIKLLEGRGVSTILLVTDSLHLKRSHYLFERAGLIVRPAPSSDPPNDASNPEDRLLLSQRTLQEIIGFLYYRAAGYI